MRSRRALRISCCPVTWSEWGVKILKKETKFYDGMKRVLDGSAIMRHFQFGDNQKAT